MHPFSPVFQQFVQKFVVHQMKQYPVLPMKLADYQKVALTSVSYILKKISSKLIKFLSIAQVKHRADCSLISALSKNKSFLRAKDEIILVVRA